ncbi:MAG: hypothetical protein ACK5XN_23400 [Bacteroidota bacterium]|jgi:hypothetical protein
MSSEQGFRGIPGVPDGWELVAIRVPMEGEWFVGVDGKPLQAKHGHGHVWPIIRKIEVPKQYRPFEGGAEFATDERDRVGVDWIHSDGHVGFYAVVSANASFAWVAFGDKVEHFAWREAFEKLQFRHADGSTSPFGVEVTSE